MQIWGKMEADMAENTAVERLCFYLNADGSGGVTVEEFRDTDAANAFSLETSLALGEFMEMESKVVLDLEAAMPALLKAVDRINA